MDIILIAAMDFNNAIGRKGGLLCKLSDDMQIFREVTQGQIVVMGRKTYESIGKPLPKRTNVVLTRDKDFDPKDPSVKVFHSMDEVLGFIRSVELSGDTQNVFVIGGGEIYNQFLPHATSLRITRIDAFFEDADTFFPQIDWDEWLHWVFEPIPFRADERNEYSFTVYTYFRKEAIY